MDYCEGCFTADSSNNYILWTPAERNGYARGKSRAFCLD